MSRKVIFALFGVSVFMLSISSVVIAPINSGKDPLPSSNFLVEIDGIVASSFTHVEGVGANLEVVEYREGNEPNDVRFLPGLSRVEPVTLKRGLTESTELFDWYIDTKDDTTTRRSMSIVIMDRGRNEMVRYNLQECFPTNYSLEPLDSNPGSVAIETIEVQCEIIGMIGR